MKTWREREGQHSTFAIAKVAIGASIASKEHCLNEREFDSAFSAVARSVKMMSISRKYFRLEILIDKQRCNQESTVSWKRITSLKNIWVCVIGDVIGTRDNGRGDKILEEKKVCGGKQNRADLIVLLIICSRP